MASGVGIFFGILFLVLVLGGAGWVAWTRIRAKRLGLPPPPLNPFARGSRSSLGGSHFPAPAPGGIVGWVNDKFSALKGGRGNKNARYAAGAYEEPGMGGSGRTARNRGTLDPDEAWDARVGTEADYGYGYEEEQELGLRDPPAATNSGPYGGSGYAGAGMYTAPPNSAGLGGGSSERGRSRTRELDERYDEEMGHRSRGGDNPFGDNAERSDLRGVSPRPMDHSGARGGATGNSPTESRRSMFREEV